MGRRGGLPFSSFSSSPSSLPPSKKTTRREKAENFCSQRERRGAQISRLLLRSLLINRENELIELNDDVRVLLLWWWWDERANAIGGDEQVLPFLLVISKRILHTVDSTRILLLLRIDQCSPHKRLSPYFSPFIPCLLHRETSPTAVL